MLINFKIKATSKLCHCERSEAISISSNESRLLRRCAPRNDVLTGCLKRHKGLSIIEVALASSLLMVAMVPILKTLTMAHSYSSQIEYKTQSLILAQGKLDEIKAKAVYSYSSSFAAANSSLGNSYLCNITDTGSASNLRTITVSAGFDKNGDGSLSVDEAQVSLTTLIANRWQ